MQGAPFINRRFPSGSLASTNFTAGGVQLPAAAVSSASFTWIARIRPLATSGDFSVFAITNGSNYNAFSVNGGSDFASYTTTFTNGGLISYVVGRWYDVALTGNAGTTKGFIRSRGSVVTTSSSSGGGTGAGDICYLGSDGPVASGPWPGTIAYSIIFNFPMTQQQILDQWRQGAPLSDKGLISYKRLLDGNAIRDEVPTARWTVTSGASATTRSAFAPNLPEFTRIDTWTSDATTSFTGTGSAAMSPDAVSGTGTETFTGTGSAAASPDAATATGAETFTGTGSSAASPMASSATGSVANFNGTGSAATSPNAVTGTATETFTGTGTAASSSFAAAATGTQTETGTASAATSPFAATATGTQALPGTAVAAASPFASDASGAETFTGTGSAAASPFAASATSTQTITGSASAAVSPFAATATGSVGAAFTGTASAALSPFASAATSAETFTGTGSSAASPFASSASGTKTLTGTGTAAASPFAALGSSSGRVAFTALASHGSGPLTNPWSNGEPRIIKDVTGGELIGFGWSDKLYIFKSGDNGNTWSFVDPTAGETIGTFRILCATQDSTGKCHIIYVDGPGGHVQYARIALSYTSGLVTGFASDVKNVTLPGSYNTSVDVRATIRAVTDALGVETLVHHTSGNVTGNTFLVQMGKATSLTPSATADFVKLDGTSGATTVFTTTGFNNHDHSSFFAQLGSTKDMWVFWGPTDAEFGGLDGTSTQRVRLTASDHTWSVGSPITMVGQDGVTTPEAMCVYGTRNFVWFMYLDPTDGLSFDKVSATGVYTHAAIATPDAGADRNGWGVFTVAPDEIRVWACWNTIASGGPGVADRTRQGFWDGASWTTYTDSQVGDSWGIGGTVQWDDGLVATRLDGGDLSISLATIRGGSVSSSVASGDAVASLSAFGASASGTETFTGSGAAATSPFSASGTGLAAFTGTASAARSTFASTASATETFTGISSASPSSFAAAATGAESLTGSASSVLSPFAGAGVGAETLTGSAGAAVSPFAASATAAQGTGAIAFAALSPFASTGAGSETIASTASAALAPAASTGTGAETVSGTATAALSPVAGTGTATEVFTSTAAAIFAAMAADGFGDVGDPSFAGTASATFAAFAALGAGVLPIVTIPIARLRTAVAGSPRISTKIG